MSPPLPRVTPISRRSRRLATVAVGLLGVLFLLAVAAPVLAPYSPDQRVGPPFGTPSAEHPLGTDDVGHDLLTQLIYGARVSLVVGLAAALVATVVGALVGLCAGYLRGWVDAVLMRAVDVVLALPTLPLAIVIGVYAGPGIVGQIGVVAAISWAGVARELRAQTLSLRERDHVQALRAMGGTAGYALVQYILPTVAPLVLPQFVLAVRTAILLQASLAFLGLADLTVPSWGNTLSVAHARGAFLTDSWPWWVLPPGLAIAATVLAFALLGYALEDRARSRGRAEAGGGDRTTKRPGAKPLTANSRGADSRGVKPRGADSRGAERRGAPLVIERLSVRYAGAPTPAVREVSLRIAAGELVGLVGESGSGKSTLASAASGLLDPAARMTEGRVVLDGCELTGLPERWLRELRGRRVALLPQEAMSALNPVRTIGYQLAEALLVPRRVPADFARPVRRSTEELRRRVTELLELVGLAAEVAGAYPHQLSGGMRQRVVIAASVARRPAVLIADEPTSGLDVLVRAEVLDLLDRLRRRFHLATLLISHDLPVLERVADRIAVLHAGELVEVGPAARILTEPRHPHTQRLVTSAPRLRLPSRAERRVRS